MYEKGQIKEIQSRATQNYYLILSHGYSTLEAQKEILSHGVKYNDLIAGILSKGIDG
jgi:hypothetical protein